jgi:chemotaxis protein MotB
MSRRAEPRPKIVVRRHAEHDHDGHSGQWKVAYADFVTAMMAFFMILWIVTTTTETQRAGIAKFFDSSATLDLHSGDNVLDSGGSLIPDWSRPTTSQALRPRHAGAEGREEHVGESAPHGAVRRVEDRIEVQRLAAMKAEIERLVASGELKDAAGHMALALTPEGLRLQIFDRDAEPMFAAGDAEPTPRLKRILGVIAPILQSVPNRIAVTGHTDNAPLLRAGYSNWELSADRANATRRQFEADGLQPGRFFRVEGMADTDPLLAQAPEDARNRRVAITVLRNDAVRELHQGRSDVREGPNP